jgi:uncharacterized membrane protein YkvI
VVILGAGFATGRELLQFFGKYSNYGFVGLIISSFIFCFIGYCVLYLCFRNGFYDYSSFNYSVFGHNLGMIIEVLAAMFLFVSYSAMISATGALFRESFKMQFSAGVGFMSFLVFITFLYGMDFIVKVNSVLAPILVVGGIFIGLYSFFMQTKSAFLYNSYIFDNWIYSAFAYSAYNITTAISVLVNLGVYVSSKKVAMYGAIVGGMFIGLLAIIFSLTLIPGYGSLIFMEIPMLKLVESETVIKNIYFFILLCAIYTTAVSNGYSFAKWMLDKLRFSKSVLYILIVITGAAFSYLGFSNFVGKAYRIFGYLGLVQVIGIAYSFYKFKRVVNLQEK